MLQPPVTTAREQLLQVIEQGEAFTYVMQFPVPPAATVRHSAVLVLFGALDSVPGAPGTPQVVHGDLDLLLTRRSDSMRYHPGQIAFPGGGVEPGDIDDAATALREAVEETGLDPAGVEILGALPPYFVSVSQNLVTPVIAWWHSPSEVAPADSESHAVFRVPVAELLDPPARGTAVLRKITQPGAPTQIFRADAFQLGAQFEHRVVWGFTGILLSSLFSALNWEEPWNKSQKFVLPPITRSS